MKAALPILLSLPLLSACGASPKSSPALPRIEWVSHPCPTPDQPTHREMTNKLFESMLDLQGVYCCDTSDGDLDLPRMGSRIITIQPACASDDKNNGIHAWYDVFFVGSGDPFLAPADEATHYHLHRRADVLTDATGETKLHLCYKNGKVDGFYQLCPSGADGGTWFYYSKQPLRHRYGVAGSSSRLIATPPPLPKNN